jgi:nucleoside-diphosphate-sugar epimerase|tara:strand:+ start:629 stop:1453 length:825 start_codon:yes stop_codon:yes gene_type:complete
MKFNCGITGHTGVLGSEIIKNNFGVKFIKFRGDLTVKKDVKKWLDQNKLDFILHLAAIVPTRIVANNFKYAKKVNYLGTKNLIDELIRKEEKIKWFFFSSTSHVYSFSKKKISERAKTIPSSKYGLTKLKAENYISNKLKKNHIPFCIGRIFSFTNKKQTESFVIPSIINKAKKAKKRIKFDNVNHFRDFLCVYDICKAIKILMKRKSTGIFNIASGKPILISNIIKLVFNKYKKNYLINNKTIGNSLIANNNKIKKLNWKPSKNIKSIIEELL